MTFSVGSLVKARDREWVVLPESTEDLLILRPLGGSEAEITGIYVPVEGGVTSATFDLPDSSTPGDHHSCSLLRDALRLGFRSSAGPFRSFGRLNVEPRPYQLVPLLMALKLDPVRLLIADDVGIGKTVEAGLVARELLDRGEVQRLAVLCPPHLAEQWQRELAEKFHIEAELVLSSTAARLERNLRGGESLFDHYPFVIVSLDFIKSDKRRDDFVRACPELVIVDEAHTCASGGKANGSQHKRHHLLQRLVQDPNRHLVLVTATPHSGDEDAFRSLLSLLSPGFRDLPASLSGDHNRVHRERLALHLVQRKRGDIRKYMDAETVFPNRAGAGPDGGEEVSYLLHPDYKTFFEAVLAYARETVQDTTGSHQRRRVRWWSALALLRSLASSPAAAVATLQNRAIGAEADSEGETDDLGRRQIMDLTDDEVIEGSDVAPGSDLGEDDPSGVTLRKRLLNLSKLASGLGGAKDRKLGVLVEHLRRLLVDGFNPIVFCRFIPTAEYLVQALRKDLQREKDLRIEAVTGLLPPSEREDRIAEIGESPRRILVATDCLSEGINLQEFFDAVIHYDLSWNPTRHEQREGRVDRYGQPNPEIRVLTLYGKDNQIDGIVLDVLLRKHKAIRGSLGISVPVPVSSEDVIEAVFEGLLLKGHDAGTSQAQLLPGFEEYFQPQREDLFAKWDQVADREKASRTVFAQHTIKVEEVRRELQAAREAMGSGVDVAAFVKGAFQGLGAHLVEGKHLGIHLKDLPASLKALLGAEKDTLTARFEPPVKDGELLLTRTHPMVESLASHILDTALDSLGDGIARRCGAIRTRAVETRTTLLLLRLRYHIIVTRDGKDIPLLAEDAALAAFEGSPANAQWLSVEQAEKLLAAMPDANLPLELAQERIRQVSEGFDQIRPKLDVVAKERGDKLLEAHLRVREASKGKGRYRIEPQLPPDVLGLYVFLPAGV